MRLDGVLGLRFVALLIAVFVAGCDAGHYASAPAPTVGDVTALTDRERSVLEALRRYATTHDGSELEQEAYADVVELGLGTEIILSRSLDQFRDPETWTIDRDVFRAYVGPFSVLDELSRDADVVMSVGTHPHCAGPPMAPPPVYRDYRRLSIQPTALPSCLQWWTVDLFLDDAGRIAAITMDRWEP